MRHTLHLFAIARPLCPRRRVDQPNLAGRGMVATMVHYANYLPDELLLEILVHLESWEIRDRQTTLARFSAVNR